MNTYTLLSQQQAEQVIEKSHQTYLQWRLVSVTERAKHLNKLASLFEEQKDAIAKLMTEEMGKVYAQGLQEVELCAGICRYSAE
ncbi:aldehyde dehydrogenase family protein, partial [Pseudoalteromonas sp. GW168-MNA-CIBAN-0100]|uniref:aldehyde dehydrogenase family protein n=1 Tax=Pseudoalteromonas sp. GW168-MNA-CIBAN-0100 TaxID=3140434 RepID=UPI00332DF100